MLFQKLEPKMTTTETLLNALVAGIHSAPNYALACWGLAIFTLLLASYKTMTGQALTVTSYDQGLAILAQQHVEARARAVRQAQALASPTAVAVTKASGGASQEGCLK
jgi:hypothetical protein